MSADNAAHRAIWEAVEGMKPHLQGIGAHIQGAALADLVAMWVAGHHPAIREEHLQIWLGAMRALVPVNEAALFERYGGKPEGWETQ